MVEMLIAVSFSVLLLTAVYSFYNASSQSYTAGVSAQNLQNTANTITTRIMEGESELGVVYRLSTSESYMIPSGTAPYLFTCGGGTQAAPCNTTSPSSEIYFCQDSTCTTSDATARWYYLDSTGTIVYYHHPNPLGGAAIEEKIYTAPTGTTIKLRFSPAAVTTPNNVVEVDVDLDAVTSPNITNSRMKTSGDVSTFILLRNHP
jgi:hypothetical protein